MGLQHRAMSAWFSSAAAARTRGSGWREGWGCTCCCRDGCSSRGCCERGTASCTGGCRGGWDGMSGDAALRRARLRCSRLSHCRSSSCMSSSIQGKAACPCVVMRTGFMVLLRLRVCACVCVCTHAWSCAQALWWRSVFECVHTCVCVHHAHVTDAWLCVCAFFCKARQVYMVQAPCPQRCLRT